MSLLSLVWNFFIYTLLDYSKVESGKTWLGYVRCGKVWTRQVEFSWVGL